MVSCKEPWGLITPRGSRIESAPGGRGVANPHGDVASRQAPAGRTLRAAGTGVPARASAGSGTERAGDRPVRRVSPAACPIGRVDAGYWRDAGGSVGRVG